MDSRSVHTGDHGHEHAPRAAPALLRRRGRRLTPQREVIWEVLVAEPDHHLSADELARRVQERLPETNASTVYRNLELLVEEGLVLRTHLGGDRAFYEPAQEHAHHHVVCERCGAVAHVHGEALGDLAARVETQTGYVLGPQEISLFGLCPACRR